MTKWETDWRSVGYGLMSFDATLAQSPLPTRDRDVIRVDFPNDKLGIAASLRQAFAAAAHDPCTRDFEKLLNELD